MTNINDIIRPQMKEHHHNYVVRTENIVHENLYGDPTRLRQVLMPNMNGIEATKVIRNSDNPLAKTIPIIAMTANAFSEDVERCLNAGMDAHMAKPVNMETLEKTVRKFRMGGGKRYGVPQA